MVAYMGPETKAYKTLVEKPKGKRPLERLKHKCEDGIKTDLTETGCEDMEWIHLSQDVNW
jgi:hypothetical protein